MSRFWTFTSTLVAGQTARSEQVSTHFNEVNTALESVANELNRSIRFTDGTPNEAQYQLAQNAAQRANRVIGFDAAGTLALLSATFTWRSDWVSATVYGVNDVIRAPVQNNLSLYICRIAHSSGDFDTDVLAGRWEIMIDLAEARRSLVLHQLLVGPDTVQLVAGQDVMCDVTNGPLNLVLPAAPAIADQPINVMHIAGNLGSFPITIQQNGKRIMGLDEDMTVTTANASFGLAFANDVYGWRIRGV